MDLLSTGVCVWASLRAFPSDIGKLMQDQLCLTFHDKCFSKVESNQNADGHWHQANVGLAWVPKWHRISVLKVSQLKLFYLISVTPLVSSYRWSLSNQLFSHERHKKYLIILLLPFFPMNNALFTFIVYWAITYPYRLWSKRDKCLWHLFSLRNDSERNSTATFDLFLCASANDPANDPVQKMRIGIDQWWNGVDRERE